MGGEGLGHICHWEVEGLEIIRQLQPLLVEGLKKIRISIGIWYHIVLNSWSHYIGHRIEIADCLSMPIKNKLIVLWLKCRVSSVVQEVETHSNQS
jgi:hypothetical protein